MALTRRALLERIGAVGGAGAAYLAMETMGLAFPTPAGAENFRLPPSSGTGRSVVVLGAGIAGLVSAYELRRAGYRVTVLEARDRIGGRAWTIRGGDRIEQTGRPDQHATFDSGLYFNAGAARIPSSHRVILGYAKRFGVPLETFVNADMATGWDFGGRVHRGRQMALDMQGRIAELLAKAIDQRALHSAMPADELAAFRRFLGRYAGLDQRGNLLSWPSSGYREPRGAYDAPGKVLDPLTIKDMLPAAGQGDPYTFQAGYDMQPTMLQPVGGMDRIARAIALKIERGVRLNEPVTAIRRAGNGVRIEHRGGVTEADFCVCTLPAHLLERIPNDFSAAKRAALRNVEYLKSAKLAFQAPRFWEDEGIYGGLAWTDRLNENVVYPSDGFHSGQGVLVGAYVAGWTHETPEVFANLPFEEQIRISRDSIEALHPGKSRLLERPIVVNWGRVPYSEGVGAIGADFDDSPPGVHRGPRYQELLKPEGPIVFAGEHLSHLGLWQEGAALSAHEALKLVAAMAADQPSQAQRG